MLSPEALYGDVALVTGGGSGIGAATVRQLARLGARVVVVDRSLEAAQSVAASLGDRAIAVRADVSLESDCVAMVSAGLTAFSKLTIAVNNAGVGSPLVAKIADLPFAEWRRITGINLDGVFLSMKAEIPAMLATGGRIVNMSSVMGAVAMGGAAAYVAAKHGVVGLTKAAALDYAALGIRVNAVGPGYVDTPLLSNRTTAQIEQTAARHPLGRIATADEVASVVCFLASPASSFVTGAYYAVDGGYLAE